MKVQISRPDQCDEIYDLLQKCGQYMRGEGIMQWNENYPLKSHVVADLDKQAMYCMIEDNKVLGIIVIDQNQSPEYDKVEWQFRDEPIIVVHRFAVLPSVQKKGIGKKLMDFAENYGVINGYQSIRLDAYSGNERTLKFYYNRGYIKVGQVNFPYRSKHFDCLEKKL